MIEITRVKYEHPSIFKGDKVQAIIKEVCMHFDVNEYQLKAKTRKNPIVLARHVATYLIREHCQMYSLKGIASIFNHRCHTTCLNSIQEVRDKLRTNPDDPLSEAYHIISQKLQF